MTRALATITLLLLAAACSDHSPPITPASSAPVKTCADQAAELKIFLRAAVDPSSPLARPWPTGDAATDARLDAVRAKAHELAKPFDPAARLEPLTATVPSIPEGFEACPQGTARFAKLGEAAPKDRLEAFAEIADGVRDCDCHVNIPLVRGLFYIVFHGPN